MKKQQLKSLSLNKKAVSNLQIENVSGGWDTEDTYTKTFIGPICNCPAPSRYGGTQSWCFCQ
ncbi:hypothetical protein C8N46_10754 [Kordia periserrulae]|uniref:Uncharacterized protein n=1 Tax=Kordia periserrulae TaxID=701523 RepID=A0A2T6BVE3_9FLAO|nr:class I lanthipeptide [Kordia periserrulae]PTX60048.1 hypothetical protein C8N46_10754 [Kordia periserrulae]